MEYPLDMAVQVEIYNDGKSLQSSISATYRDYMREDYPYIARKQCVLIYGDDV